MLSTSPPKSTTSSSIVSLLSNKFYRGKDIKAVLVDELGNIVVIEGNPIKVDVLRKFIEELRKDS